MNIRYYIYLPYRNSFYKRKSRRQSPKVDQVRRVEPPPVAHKYTATDTGVVM